MCSWRLDVIYEVEKTRETHYYPATYQRQIVELPSSDKLKTLCLPVAIHAYCNIQITSGDG